jgi:hypothetical protein
MIDPLSELTDPSWPEIIRALQKQVQSQIHTSLPGKVRSYDVTTQTAEVELLVQLDGVEVPPLADVPVIWPGGSAGFLHVPLAANDTVMVVFAEEDFAKWYDTGSVSAPATLARHGLHAVAIPGLRRAAAPLTVTGGHVTLGATSELRLGSDAASVYVALATLVDARFAALVSYINTHTHTGVTTGPGVSGVPAPLLAAQASVAATKVKAV